MLTHREFLCLKQRLVHGPVVVNLADSDRALERHQKAIKNHTLTLTLPVTLTHSYFL
jgi:hypothetical protein